MQRPGSFSFSQRPAAPKSSNRALIPINFNSLAPRTPPPYLLLKPSNLPLQPVISRSSFPIAAEALDSARKLPKQDTSTNLAYLQCGSMGNPMSDSMLLGIALLFLLQVPSHTVNASSTGPIVGLESSLVQKLVGMTTAQGWRF